MSNVQPSSRPMATTNTASVIEPSISLSRRYLTSDRVWVWLLPVVLFLLFLGIYPLLYNVWNSFREFDPMSGRVEPVGLDNWRRLIEELTAPNGRARESLITTAEYVSVALIVEFVLGLGIAGQQPDEINTWLKDVGGQFSGASIKVVSEETPPSRAIINLKKALFEDITGITVNWEVVPLDQVLAKVSQDAATQAGANDIYYFDQAWVGRFINDTFDPRELLESKPDLAMPNYNIDDFLEPLVLHIATYGDKMIGLPCDVPIFMYFYRQDIYDELGLKPATTMEEYLAHAKAINEAKSGEGTYGTVGQMKSGHYALNCDMTAYVWSHGGSVFTADGKCALNDEQAITGVDYMRELQQYMPAAVTTYDWGGQFTAIQQGQGGQVMTWGEDFPGWDDPDSSKVSGLMQPAPLPANAAQRPAADAGFEEVPDLGHQGGSTYCLSKYSKQADPAWFFLQWATSSNTQTLASVIGGGASPMRQSTFDDPRVKAEETVGAGTTRHFPQMLEVINTRMGTEPHLLQWPLIATDIIAVELGKLTTGGYGSTQEGMDQITKLVDEAAAK